MESPAALDVGLRERFHSANSGGGWCVKTHTHARTREPCSEQRNRILYKQCAK